MKCVTLCIFYKQTIVLNLWGSVRIILLILTAIPPGLLRCNRPITLYKFNGACVPLGPRQLRTGCAFSTLPRSLLLAGFRGLQRFQGPLYFRSMKKVVDSWKFKKYKTELVRKRHLKKINCRAEMLCLFWIKTKNLNLVNGDGREIIYQVSLFTDSMH